MENTSTNATTNNIAIRKKEQCELAGTDVFPPPSGHFFHFGLSVSVPSKMHSEKPQSPGDSSKRWDLWEVTGSWRLRPCEWETQRLPLSSIAFASGCAHVAGRQQPSADIRSAGILDVPALTEPTCSSRLSSRNCLPSMAPYLPCEFSTWTCAAIREEERVIAGDASGPCDSSLAPLGHLALGQEMSNKRENRTKGNKIPKPIDIAWTLFLKELAKRKNRPSLKKKYAIWSYLFASYLNLSHFLSQMPTYRPRAL